MFTPTFLLLAFAVMILSCVAFMLRQVAKAPVGFEDEDGFHMQTPETRDLLDSDLSPTHDMATHRLSHVGAVMMQR